MLPTPPPLPLLPTHAPIFFVRETPMSRLKIALAPGDGIGPEIMSATIGLLEAAGVTAHVDFVPVEVGASIYDRDARGLTDEAIATIEDCGIVFKGPMATPKGGGGKSINVTLRKMYGAYA